MAQVELKGICRSFSSVTVIHGNDPQCAEREARRVFTPRWSWRWQSAGYRQA